MPRSHIWRRVAPCVVVIALIASACSHAHKQRNIHPTTTTTSPVNRVRVVPSSIDPTGRVDVTELLQKFFERAPDGSDIQLRQGARYLVDDTLRIFNRNRLTIDGNGATVFTGHNRPDPTKPQWWIKDGTSITIRNLTVIGANPDGGLSEQAYVKKFAFQHGFKIEGTNGVDLDHLTVTDVYGDFVYVGRDTTGKPPRTVPQNVWIHDSTFARNGRQGISVTAGTNVIIERNSFDNTRRATIDIEPPAHSWQVTDLFVLDNTVGAGRLFFVAAHGQGPVDDVVISGNTFRDHDLNIDEAVPDLKQPRSNWVVTDNTSNTTVHHRTMRFMGINGLLLRGNQQSVTGSTEAIVLGNVCGAQVNSNQFGVAHVHVTGAKCNARLFIPTPAPMPGRG